MRKSRLNRLRLSFKGILILTLALTFLTFLTFVAYAGIQGTKHDLSLSGTGTIKATAASGVTQKCVFCHTPHSSTKDGPLWNHSLSSATYVVCNPSDPSCSIARLLTPSQPDGSSKLCLACHDGTVALGLLVNMPGSAMAGTVAMTQTYMTGNSLLGTDIRGKHPVSIVMNSPNFIAAKKAQCNSNIAQGIRLPVSTSPVKLYTTNNKYNGDPLGQSYGIQCRTCHDPHEDSGNWKCFLVHESGINCTTCPCDPALGAPPGSNADALCVVCHYGPPCP